MSLSNLQLPQVIDLFFQASNGHHTEAMLACFTDDAVIRDDNRIFKGAAAITGWSDKEYIGAKVQITILSCSSRGTELIVSTEVNGNYPECPYYFDYTFTIEAGLIKKLQISMSQ
ncbi:nuclear transport factor 2 family protein [Paenibacillaceae bacterium]|nr:nuclear transport factor 2 family protein [Paenibacillaceae bacterium]